MQLSMPYFEQAKVLVVGDVMLDRYWHGASSRISPEAPVPVVNISQTEDRPGGAANVALNLAALGCQVTLLGVIGLDEAGMVLEQRLQSTAIVTDFHRSLSKPTITKLRVISRHQQLLRMDFEDRYTWEDSCALAARVESHLDGVDVLILSDYAKGSLQDCQALIQKARSHNIPVLVDPKSSNYQRYQQATLLTPNLHEFEQVVGNCRSERELLDKAREMIDSLQLNALLITRGEQGMTLIRPGHSELHLPARAREVFDVTGAGDTVIAALSGALAAGETLPESVAIANLAAGIVVGKLGTATVSAPELRWAIYAEQGFECGVVTEEQLLLALADVRANGEKIVFTNGCFDIIHAGHVGYLEEARKLGHRLVVAVNSDASVKRLKGDGRPINTLDRRMAVLAGLEAVDWVIGFDEDTPERLIDTLKPDILVKGGDYREDQVVGAPIVKTYGGQVKVLSFFDNCSTTSIVNKIRKNALFN
ncbi:bifunctional D-glycero-beta-D-manno-heptose-7-phosphate kinase/D-glycero-beta-D-manno-heptose 1-phosphate adenylyltransferase HldE [Cellvibrio japonicus]|uniref:Bifunctional protein HldE n=1 Tax=Cellvibrio japonicus (strain Ueda107) TaxID=498211 RepID=B3PIZ8_CELJU|nr:bifunctional D-glycero-beta-D-manno-heptose-7-phosphate kinase/D-glycero-beta-D-manno-heptose 1-phosphate adenylyltransferase HldE [Cellvibrio japonicus]ACE86096.1 LPS biosynthesis protein RfaE [Cellvibrio japonicus Ueda107]QEI11203.1 bifunctional D-glycero-beta-D-manno-heptose-7-phosphate kinase/D-glycero-beta-D-manno-heptose 1-phosphate adenylyltransferase HldE [Cellvibrio japonicus]QEI14777.1 bifunctional D-glycero-beta-D-manno-heptose-7-phosphate kinase/D-glycero-beta-D-manno-heptose 1-ph